MAAREGLVSGAPDHRDQLPRIFQANLDRLFVRVIQPALAALPVHAHLEHGETAMLDQFLDRAAQQVDNHTANEAAKAFTLTIAAVFERQLSVWARVVDPTAVTGRSAAPRFAELLAICARHGKVDLGRDDLGSDLDQLLVVANVVRHGEGPACSKLGRDFPQFWDDQATDYIDLLPGPPLASEHVRIRFSDVVRFIEATVRFWGRADPLPLAVTDHRYRLA